MGVKIGYFVKRYRGLKTPLYGEIQTLKHFEPIILTKMLGKSAFRYSELKIFSSSSIPWWRFGYRDRIFFRDALLKNQIRLVRAYMADGGIEMWPLCEELNLPLITSFHGVDVSERPRRPSYLHKLKELFEKGKIFLVRSKAMREDVVNLGCPANKIKVLYGGVDIDEFRFKKDGRVRAADYRY